MDFLKKALNKIRYEKRFLLEQKWGWAKPGDKFAISKSALKKYIPSNAVMIDCGAHIGADSAELARVFPQGVVHAFEPVPAVFMQLEKNTSHLPNVKRYKIALSDKESIMAMYVSSGRSDASSSLLAPKTHLEDHPGVLFENKIDVHTTTLDAWAKQNNVSHVDFLWLDMQGFEYQMIKASTKILPAVKAVFTEVSLKETYEGCILYPQLKRWMKEKQFDAVMEILPEGADMGNVLFVRAKN